MGIYFYHFMNWEECFHFLNENGRTLRLPLIAFLHFLSSFWAVKVFRSISIEASMELFMGPISTRRLAFIWSRDLVSLAWKRRRKQAQDVLYEYLTHCVFQLVYRICMKELRAYGCIIFVQEGFQIPVLFWKSNDWTFLLFLRLKLCDGIFFLLI